MQRQQKNAATFCCCFCCFKEIQAIKSYDKQFFFIRARTPKESKERKQNERVRELKFSESNIKQSERTSKSKIGKRQRLCVCMCVDRERKRRKPSERGKRKQQQRQQQKTQNSSFFMLPVTNYAKGHD